MSQIPPSIPPRDQEVFPEDFAPIGAPRQAAPAARDYRPERNYKKLWLTVGLIVAALGVLLWVLFGAGFIGVFTASGQPRKLAQDFVRMTADGAVDAAMDFAAPGLSRGAVERHHQRMAAWGAYQDLTSWSSSINAAGGVTTCSLEGTAVFTDGEHPFRMELVREGETWKVSFLEFD